MRENDDSVDVQIKQIRPLMPESTDGGIVGETIYLSGTKNEKHFGIKLPFGQQFGDISLRRCSPSEILVSFS